MHWGGESEEYHDDLMTSSEFNQLFLFYQVVCEVEDEALMTK